MMTQKIFWTGAGWYAPLSTNSRSNYYPVPVNGKVAFSKADDTAADNRLGAPKWVESIEVAITLFGGKDNVDEKMRPLLWNHDAEVTA